jgi:hypothetical protein
MSDVPFYRTQMGHRFYEHTMPELVRQIGRLADLLERSVTTEAGRRREAGAADESPPPQSR